jgi:cytochrome c2
VPSGKKTSEVPARIAALKATLTESELARADRSRGRQLFARTCQPCHTLFGTGGKVGPDLTGSNLTMVKGSKVVGKEGGGNYSVGARDSWYPSLNSFRDHSRYRLTFKAPKRYTLVSVGKRVREWTEGDFACSEWDSEVPIAVAGFNLGERKVFLTSTSAPGYARATRRRPSAIARDAPRRTSW